MSEKPKGHLFIHGITEEQADLIMQRFKESSSLFIGDIVPVEADWWTQENVDILDNAAMFAMTTHGLPKPKQPKHYGENKK